MCMMLVLQSKRLITKWTNMDIHQQPILILDFGSQYSQLIARRVRESGVYCELHHYDMSIDDIKAFSPKGIIMSGGPKSVTKDISPRVDENIFSLGVPILGICYGMQTMAQQLDGTVENAKQHEYGHAQVAIIHDTPLFQDIDDHINEEGKALLDVWMSHGDHVTQLPAGFINIAETDNAPIAAIADINRNFYGCQFHPEVTHTRQGLRIIQNFLFHICQCQKNWTAENIIEQSIADIKQQVGSQHVILGLSGGVDSSVAAILLHQAIGDQLSCIFVDNGLLRMDEGEQVMATFAEHFQVNVIRVNAQEAFYSALEGVTDPEQKRKIIGNLFIEIFEQEAKKIPDAAFLAQGTIYPDVIESAASKTQAATVIKSHHNVGGLPEHMALDLVEPLRELFKDEVRNIGLKLGIPYDMIYRHPFPGPGLAVRILGEVKSEFAEILKKADAIYTEELNNHDLYYKVSQAFAVFIPVKSVAVKGDARSYDYVVCLRAVTTVDFMTAEWAKLPYEFLAKVSQRIINEIAGISRVTYDISDKPPATIEWE